MWIWIAASWICASCRMRHRPGGKRRKNQLLAGKQGCLRNRQPRSDQLVVGRSVHRKRNPRRKWRIRRQKKAVADDGDVNWTTTNRPSRSLNGSSAAFCADGLAMVCALVASLRLRPICPTVIRQLTRLVVPIGRTPACSVRQGEHTSTRFTLANV